MMKCCTDNKTSLVVAAAAAVAQGRGLNTNAYTHSLESAHHMYMKLDNGKVRHRRNYCPQGLWFVGFRVLGLQLNPKLEAQPLLMR